MTYSVPTPPLPVSSNQKQITEATRGEVSGLFSLSPFRWRYICCFGFHNPRGLCLHSKIHPTKSGNWIWESLQWELGHWWWTREVRALGDGAEERRSSATWRPGTYGSSLRFSPCPLSPERGWIFQRQLSNFAHKQVTGRYSKNPLIWNTVRRNKTCKHDWIAAQFWCSLQVT